MPKAAERPIYRLTLRPEPGINPVLGLRALLKVLLRAHGFRCLRVVEEPTEADELHYPKGDR
jgi:hypothetical protein